MCHYHAAMPTKVAHDVTTLSWSLRDEEAASRCYQIAHKREKHGCVHHHQNDHQQYIAVDDMRDPRDYALYNLMHG
jgi:hypothetical protein